MKILHITPAYVPAYEQGGPIWSVHLLNKWLVRKGTQVVVYTTDIGVPDSVPRGKPVDVDGVEVWYFPITLKRWAYSYQMMRRLSDVGEFDVFHITSVFLSVSTLGAYYAKKFNIPYVISPRGSLMEATLKKNGFVKKFYIAVIERKNLECAAAIHFTTEQEKQEYCRLGFPMRKGIIIPNGIELDFERETEVSFRKKFGIAENKKIVLFLGRINWKKGFDTLIPAFARVSKKEENALLVVAGGDEKGYGREVERMMRKEGIGERVIFTGMILGDTKRAALQESEIFILPSYAENFGMAVAEAMWAGLPVVITGGVGIARDVRAAEAGRVVSKSVAEVAGALETLLSNPKKRDIMGANGKRLVRDKFLAEKVAEQWIVRYKELISSEL